MGELCAYKGDQPYIFVSYAHRDAEQVFPLLEALQDAGFRIWFDHGIEAGTEWSNNIAEHLSGCSAFLFFVSQNSVKSENCLDEVAYAKSHNKPALLACLEENVILPAGADMQTARFQRMYINRQPNMASFVKNFSAAAIFKDCRSEINAVLAKKPSAGKKPLSKVLLIGVLAVVVLAVAALLIIPKLGTDAPQEDDSSVGSSPATQKQEPEEPEIVELSNSLQDHTFRLDGVVYRLPVSYAQLAANGWTIGAEGASSNTYIAGATEKKVTLVKDGKSISVRAYNDGENARQLKDCRIGLIEVEYRKAVDFCIAAGMTPGDTAQAFVEKFGTPSTRKDNGSGETLVWKMGNLACVTVKIYTGDMAKYSVITMEHYVLSQESAETRQDAPAYLDEYSAPESLGADLMSGLMSVDGVVYALPVPLREFLNNGWQITASSTGAIISGGSSEVKLKKGASTLEVTVKNPWIYKTIPENGIVVSVTAEADNNVQIQLPGGITMGMSREQLVKALPSYMSTSEGYSADSYYCSDYTDRDYRVSITVSKAQEKVTKVVIINGVSDLID